MVAQAKKRGERKPDGWPTFFILCVRLWISKYGVHLSKGTQRYIDFLFKYFTICATVEPWNNSCVCDEESHQQRGVLQKRFGVKRPYPCSTRFMAFMGFMFFFSFFKFNIISSSFIFVELKEAQKRKKQLEDRCKIEDSIGTAAQTWNQEILPNWSTM